MELKLTEKEIACLNNISTLINFKSKENLFGCSTTHVVYRRCDDEFEGGNSISHCDIKYNISGEEYNNLEEIKLELKEELFGLILEQEKYTEVKNAFNLDESGELFVNCPVKPKGFFEARKDLKMMLLDISSIQDFDTLKEKIKAYYESGTLKESSLFPSDVFEYSEIRYIKKFVPTAIFTNKTEAKKYTNQLTKKGIECYFESKSTKDNKTDIAILKKLLLKLSDSI